MKSKSLSMAMALAALALASSSCTTPQPPQVFHPNSSGALVIDSLDANTCKLLQPAAAGPRSNDSALAEALALPQHNEAVIILENYTEPTFGEQFRNRGTSWFVGLRNLGYQRIVFLQGNGVANPDGLITLVEYE